MRTRASSMSVAMRGQPFSRPSSHHSRSVLLTSASLSSSSLPLLFAFAALARFAGSSDTHTCE